MTVMECAKLLGETLAKDPIIEEFTKAKTAYEESAELADAMAEYTTPRTLLGREYAKDNEMQDAEVVLALQKRIGELAAFINNHPLYLAYLEGQKKVAALMTEVNSEINFYAFGERPCTHDCSTCSSNCGSRR